LGEWQIRWLVRKRHHRVALRSTLVAGKITLTASRAGLAPAPVPLVSQPVAITDGLER